ncbi:MAG: tyrosine-type recombinase/integrase [Eubacteriales bacterium]|nr:tyrosine-type recombinase/integrase [Eubacteriales bacterium]
MSPVLINYTHPIFYYFSSVLKKRISCKCNFLIIIRLPICRINCCNYRSTLQVVTAHSLSHTNATLQVAGGVDIRTVSKRLGHAQTSTTMYIYSHAIQSADDAAADAPDDVLNSDNN